MTARRFALIRRLGRVATCPIGRPVACPVALTKTRFPPFVFKGKVPNWDGTPARLREQGVTPRGRSGSQR